MIPAKVMTVVFKNAYRDMDDAPLSTAAVEAGVRAVLRALAVLEPTEGMLARLGIGSKPLDPRGQAAATIAAWRAINLAVAEEGEKS